MPFSDAELAAFLDEALPPARCAQLEHDLRTDAELRNRLIEVRGRETAGLHTLGAIWRRIDSPARHATNWGSFYWAPWTTIRPTTLAFISSKLAVDSAKQIWPTSRKPLNRMRNLPSVGKNTSKPVRVTCESNSAHWLPVGPLGRPAEHSL